MNVTLPPGLAEGLIASLLAFALAACLTPWSIKAARLLGVIDRPTRAKIHDQATPLMGGTAIAASFLLVAGCWYLYNRFLFPSQPPNGPFIALLVGGLLATLLGIADELLTLKPRVHFIGQLGVVIVALIAGFPRITRVSNPFTPVSTAHSGSVYLSALLGVATGPHDMDAAPVLTLCLGSLFTVFWIVGMMNAMNFLDGLDGLAGGVGAIAALFLALWAIVVQQSGYAPTHDSQNVVLPLILCGASVGFLLYNWAPARVFMGDSGSMFIGFMLGALSIFGPVKLGTALLLLIIPIVDVAWAITRRLMRGRSFTSGDKNHIHHRLLQAGLSRQQVVLLFYAVCIGLGVIDLRLYKRDKLVAFALVTIGAVAAAIALEVRGRRLERQATIDSALDDVPITGAD